MSGATDADTGSRIAHTLSTHVPTERPTPLAYLWKYYFHQEADSRGRCDYVTNDNTHSLMYYGVLVFLASLVPAFFTLGFDRIAGIFFGVGTSVGMVSSVTHVLLWVAGRIYNAGGFRTLQFILSTIGSIGLYGVLLFGWAPPVLVAYGVIYQIPGTAGTIALPFGITALAGIVYYWVKTGVGVLNEI